MRGLGYAAAAKAFQEKDYLRSLRLLNGLLDERATPEVLALLGETLEKIGLPAEAAEAFEQAAGKAESGEADLLRRAALLHAKSGAEERAQLLGLKLLTIVPKDADIAFMLANLFVKNNELELLRLVMASLIDSDNPEHLTLAGTLVGMNDRDPANLTLFRKLAAVQPDDPFTQYRYMSVARDFCDFEAVKRLENRVKTETGKGNLAFLAGETGYSNLLHCGDEGLNRLAVNNGMTQAFALSASISAKKRMSGHSWEQKIRIGYLSGDFWDDHATMRLFQSVLEQHEQSLFEITLYCHTPSKFVAFDSGNRRKWGRIVSITEDTDTAAADRMRADGIDILVDLKGHTADSRSRILNLMVAPVQVAWLGFPGSLVDIDCDYVIGDPIVLPRASRRHYHEKFCCLPECYQPNDPVYRPLPAASTRRELGLTEDRFIFASFNAARKISFQVLDCYAEILNRTPHSALWIMIDGDLARSNFITAMTNRGVAAQRILFAGKMNYEGHVARLQAADLALDTFPYNGHTTTSDQLWAGLPVLTKKGTNFASRVSESLLMALGLPELVAADQAAYVDQAVALSNDPATLLKYRQHIDRQRFIAPLFDAERFCRHLEAAYETMAGQAKAHQPPDHIDIPALPLRSVPFR